MRRKSLILVSIFLMFVSQLYAEEATRESVMKLYVATFDRAADQEGIDYWLNDSGLSLEDIANSFFDQEETQTLYPKGYSNVAFINAIYQNLFKRLPDQEGQDYWENELENGSISRSVFILAVVNGAQGDDATILNNKTEVGIKFVEVNLNDLGLAKSVMSNVTSDYHTVTCALAIISGSSSCSEVTSSSSPSPQPTVKTAVLYDSIVTGARYDAGSGITGTTDANGLFRYIEGQAIKFYIGDVFIGEGHPIDKPAGVSVVTDKIVTPLGLASAGEDINNPRTLRIVRFLMSLDRDGNADNGIEVDLDRVSGKNLRLLDEEVDLDTIFNNLTLPSSARAREHICQSLRRSHCSQGPVIVGIPKTVANVHSPYQFLPMASDINGDTLTFSIINKPSWANFNTTTGLLQGVPPLGSEGNYSDINISVTDGSESMSLAPFSIAVGSALDIAHKFGVATQGTADSYYYYSSPDKAIDNNETTYNHTSGDTTENWLQVALPSPTLVSKVVIQGRSTHTHRLSGAKAYLLQTPYSGTLDENDKIATLLGNAQRQTTEFTQPKSANYLLIKADGTNNLHLATVEVYGEMPKTPKFNRHESSYLIPFGSSVGSTVVTLGAVDYQDEAIRYSINNPAFIIDSDGNIKVASALQGGAYNVVVTASDGINETTTNFTINVTSSSAAEDAIASGSVANITEKELIEATVNEFEASKTTLLDAKAKIFNLNSDGTAKADGSSLTSIDWNPTHDASLVQFTEGRNTPLLYTNAVTQSDKTIYHKEIGIIGERGEGRYLVLGGNPLRMVGNEEMDQVMENSISWLTGRDNLKTDPFNVVIAHLDESYYFKDESKTREWLDAHYAGQVAYNVADSCDGTALAGCLANSPDLLIISQIAQEGDDVEAIASTVNQALENNISVLYIHHNGDHKPLGEELFSSVFDVTYLWDNYWKRLSLDAYDPTANLNTLPESLVSIQKVMQHIRDADYNFDWSLCDGGSWNATCSEVAGFNEEFRNGALEVKSIFNDLDSNKQNIFQLEGYRLYKLLALLGDKIRQSTQFPMDKVTTDDSIFLKSLFADYTIYNYRSINPVQPDMGNFSRSDFSHINPTTKVVNLVSKKKFRSTGVYALPGQTMRVTRNDSAGVTTKLFINPLRSQSTHEFEANGYKRPKFLQSAHIEIVSGESIEVTSPYGGPVYIEFDTNAQDVEFRFENVGEHPYWTNPADNALFTSKLDDGEYDWAELVTDGFEVHSTLEKMRESIADAKWGTAEALAAATRKYIGNYPYVLAGFRGDGVDVVNEIHDFATTNSLMVEIIDTVQHMNADQASCGYGCSGNPYDAYWAFDPIGHGDVHELGHNLEKTRFMFEGFERHAITNPYSYYTKSKYNEITGGDPDCQNLPFETVFEKLQASVNEANATQYLKDNLWSTSSWSHQVLVTIQAMMHTQKMGKLENGWHLLGRLHLLEREVKRADDDWEANRANLGFSSYTLDEFNAMRKNDWLLVSFSFAAGLDFRDYFTMMGMEYSAKASVQVANFGYEAVPKKYFVSTPNGYCKTDEYGSYLDKSMLNVDGTTAFPY